MSQLLKKSFLGATMAAASLMAGFQAAHAAPARVNFTPPYGAPFPNLEWFGEAVIDDGSCLASGSVSNLFGPCAGEFTFLSATVYFADISAPAVKLQALNFTGSTVLSVDRSSPTPSDWTAVYSLPFTPVKGLISQTMYGSDNAYFSLVFVGGYAQLFWFRDDPGNILDSAASLATYIGCYEAGPGDHAVGDNRCGLSSNLDGKGALLSITAVPEPSTYAMMFAGLGAIGWLARRRSRRA